MAAIDDLLARIDDPALRADLHRELAPLRGERQFGLVFERHLPEKVRLHGLPIRRGALVEYRADPHSPTWQVQAIKDGEVHLMLRTDTETLTDTASIDDLVLVREFGQPVYPGLRSVGRVERGVDKPFHAVINGENYHALEALLYAYEHQVDAIYIDPPYNSGAPDWKYNNDYVDGSDAYRHSKWLSFMEKRLRIAKNLLRPDDSVLIVAIDENEVHRLTLLLEDVFPSSKIQMVTVLINPAGATIIDQFHRVDEQLLFVHIGAARPRRTVAETTVLPSAKAADQTGGGTAAEGEGVHLGVDAAPWRQLATPGHEGEVLPDLHRRDERADRRLRRPPSRRRVEEGSGEPAGRVHRAVADQD